MVVVAIPVEVVAAEAVAEIVGDSRGSSISSSIVAVTVDDSRSNSSSRSSSSGSSSRAVTGNSSGGGGSSSRSNVLFSVPCFIWSTSSITGNKISTRVIKVFKKNFSHYATGY